MNDQDKERFAQIMTGIAENFGSQLSKPGLSMRFEVLREYPIRQVEHAAYSLMKNRKYTNMPTVAEFLEHIEGGSVEDIAQVEATKALQVIKEHGPYESVAFDSPVTQAVIEYGFGGWQKLNKDLMADNEKWFLKDFEKLYKSYSRQNVQLKGKLRGIVEHHNDVVGQGEIPETQLVGDKNKAKQVALSKDNQENNDKQLGIISDLLRDNFKR